MKRILILGAVGLLSLSACSLQQAAPNSVRLPADQALLVAEAGTDGVNNAAVAAAPALDAATKAKVKAGIDTVNNTVSAAHAAYVKGDLPTTISDLQSAMGDIATLEQELKH